MNGKSVVLLSDNVMASGNRYLMSALIAESIPTNLLIYKFDHSGNKEALFRFINEWNTRVVGISLFSTRRIEFQRLSEEIKERFPGVAIVCGGPDVNSNPLNAVRWADYVCLFDGEKAFPRLCKELMAHKAGVEVRIPNIIYKSGSEIVRNDLCIEPDLDTYEFPYFDDANIFQISSGSILPYKDSLQSVYNVYASRGCLYKCSYCANHVFTRNFPGDKYYRFRSVDDIIEEILSVLPRMPRIKSLTFTDEQFGINMKWFDEFISKYKKHISLPFFVQMNPVTISREKIKKLKDIGLVLMSFGVQSGSERIRKLYCRPENLESIRKANRIMHDLKVTHFFDLIVDNPYETSQDIEATLKFLLTLKKPFFAKTFDLVHLPHTELTELLLKEKKITRDQVEGNFLWGNSAEWRVTEKNIGLSLGDKYLVALIHMTGNFLLPNFFIKFLLAARKYLPWSVKTAMVKAVLSNKFYKIQLTVNTVFSLTRDKGLAFIISKIIKVLMKRWEGDV